MRLLNVLLLAAFGLAPSLITPATSKLQAKDFFVESFPGQPLIDGQTKPVQFAGVLPTKLPDDDDKAKDNQGAAKDKDERHLFFWLIESDLELLPRKKFIIWLNGGTIVERGVSVGRQCIAWGNICTTSY